MGKHFLLNIFGVNPTLLQDLETFMRAISPNLAENLAEVVGEVSYKFPGDEAGYTALYLLSSSHFSIHTWPEKGCAAIDMFSCGDIRSEEVIQFVVQFFSPTEYETKMVVR